MARLIRHLTARQLEILERLTRPGATARSVAADLGIAEQSVRNATQGIYRTLGVTSLAQAVRVVRPKLKASSR